MGLFGEDAALAACCRLIRFVLTAAFTLPVTLKPRSTRCARIFIGRSRPWICVRLIAVNSYYFYLVITGEQSVPVPEGELLEFRQGIKGNLLPNSGELELRDHQSDFFEMHAPHLHESRKLYKEFMSIYRRPH